MYNVFAYAPAIRDGVLAEDRFIPRLLRLAVLRRERKKLIKNRKHDIC